MQAAIDGKPFVQQYPIDADEPLFKKEIQRHRFVEKNTYTTHGSRRARRTLLGHHIKRAVPDCYADLGYRTVSTNPCGEIPCAPTTPAVCWPLTYIHM